MNSFFLHSSASSYPISGSRTDGGPSPSACALAAALLSLVALPSAAPAALSGNPPPSITLVWNANPEPELTGYKVYYGTTSGVYTQTVDVGKVTTITLSDLVADVPLFSVVTAYDADGLESPPSEEISFTVTAPPSAVLTMEPITLGPGVVFPAGGKAPIISNRTLESSSDYGFTLSAPAGQTLDIYASDDMLNWVLIGTTTNSTGYLRVTDHEAAAVGQRYYQIRPR